MSAIFRPSGRTTRYSYASGEGAAREHALTSVEYPGGTHQFFTYDDLGRLAETDADGGAEEVRFGYDTAGGVTATDALNHTSRYFFDDRGLLVKTEDALGNAVSLAFDDNNNAGKVTKHFVKDAVEALLAGKKPPVTETRQRGCSVKYDSQ